jgi:hypothetical protein
MIRAAILVLFFCTAVFVGPSFCQQMTITIDKPFVSRSLSGIVTDGSGEPVPGAYVELRTRKWRKLLKTTKTNVNGWFGFKTMGEATYYLTIPHFSGFQEYNIKIRVTRAIRKIPQVKLEVAT